MADMRLVRPEAEAAWNQLGAVLTDLRAEGRTIPCWTDPAPYTSEDPALRAEAAVACGWCPALLACSAYADAQRESAWTWGGRDRSPRPINRTTEELTR